MYKYKPPHKSLRMTRDHIFPRTPFPAYRGHPHNTVKCCQGCNNAKADMHPFDWAITLRDGYFGMMVEQFRLLGVPELCLYSIKRQRRKRLRQFK